MFLIQIRFVSQDFHRTGLWCSRVSRRLPGGEVRHLSKGICLFFCVYCCCLFEMFVNKSCFSAEEQQQLVRVGAAEHQNQAGTAVSGRQILEGRLGSKGVMSLWCHHHVWLMLASTRTGFIRVFSFFKSILCFSKTFLHISLTPAHSTEPEHFSRDPSRLDEKNLFLLVWIIF